MCQDAGGDLHRVLAAACEPVPAWDPVVYLADFAHRVLFPLAKMQVASQAAPVGFMLCTAAEHEECAVSVARQTEIIAL